MLVHTPSLVLIGNCRRGMIHEFLRLRVNPIHHKTNVRAVTEKKAETRENGMGSVSTFQVIESHGSAESRCRSPFVRWVFNQVI
jgi:hypothetical protein